MKAQSKTRAIRSKAKALLPVAAALLCAALLFLPQRAAVRPLF